MEDEIRDELTEKMMACSLLPDPEEALSWAQALESLRPARGARDISFSEMLNVLRWFCDGIPTKQKNVSLQRVG